MTMAWKKAIRNKRKYAVQFSKNRTQENFELKKKYRNIATRESRKAIKHYWRKKSEELNEKPSEFYKTFRPFLNNKSTNSSEISLRNENGNIITDQLEVADLLANYFTYAAANVGGDHVRNITENECHNHYSVQNIRNNYENINFDFKRVKQEEVKSELDNLNTKKSSGWNSTMSPKLVKLISVGITPSLTKLYNECIEESQWPLDWKKGEWIPVFKKDNKQKKENYSPITTLLTVDKIFEKLICTQVVDKYDDSLYSRMTGYRKRHSCETTLLGLVENWKKATDNKEVVCILSTDMSKAFDSLGHSLALKKLEAFGFCHASMKLMRSFFENRSNRVRIGNTTSTWKKDGKRLPSGVVIWTAPMEFIPK